ncbi:cyclic pyranopterin monophosphate synthase MoaC [Lutispora sp.]|uniref:cyclic pyranopterin monophosphate synthase MoaC n=1 Tax=Lutispora sp. TaxID=2828727 RepID=UPI000EE606DA|nr:cyclic pyranopterin monophosphate synthase MoaC [Lutispora sp.]MEA4963459.1 cyclic pyranopterin monophosphate synthase MoaC [Lutispora sp.]HCJ56362.1 cyclic pyranopterin monophosphate synthase MoaC [Clostridiaceae bacterium]
MERLTHINEKGYAKMVDVTEKEESLREAVARGSIYMKKETIRAVSEGKIKKGDVLSVAQVGGIMGAKSTSVIIPMCHNINIYGADLEFNIDKENCKIDIIATVKTYGVTGVEMEALTAVSIAALTIYDMCKAIDKEMVISDIHLVKKTGGKSGDFYFRDLGSKC